MKIKFPSRRNVLRYYRSARVWLSRRVYWWLWHRMYVGPSSWSRIFPWGNRVEVADPYENTIIQWLTFKGIDLEIANTECQVIFSDYFRIEVALLGIRVNLFLEFFAEVDALYSNMWGGSCIDIRRGPPDHPEPVEIYQFSPTSERHETKI